MRLQWLFCSKLLVLFQVIYLHGFSYAVLAIVQLSSVSSQHCSLPTSSEIEQVLQISDNLPGRMSSSNLTGYVFTCLAVEAQDLYSSVSVAIRFTSSDQGPNAFFYTQFQMFCGSSSLGTSFHFNLQQGFESGQSAADAYNTFNGGGGPNSKSRRDCSTCTNIGTRSPQYDDIANCAGNYYFMLKVSTVVMFLIYSVFRELSRHWNGVVSEQQPN